MDYLNHIFIGGSSSYKDVDSMSDIDVFCVVETGKEKSFHASIKNFIDNQECIVYVIYNRHYDWFGNLTTFYYREPLYFSIDLGLINDSELKDFFVEPNAVIIKDKNDKVKKRQQVVKSNERKRLNNMVSLQLNQVFSTIVKIRKGLHRDHLFDVAENISQLRRAYILLLRVEKSIGMTTPLLGRPERDVEDYDCLDDLKDIKKSLPFYNKQEMINCAIILIRKFNELNIFRQEKELYRETNNCINIIKNEFRIGH